MPSPLIDAVKSSLTLIYSKEINRKIWSDLTIKHQHDSKRYRPTLEIPTRDRCVISKQNNVVMDGELDANSGTSQAKN